MENIINDKEINLNIFDTIKRYPFNGKSQYLIDKFYLIGYEYNLIHKMFIESQIKDLIKEEPKEMLVNSGFNDLLMENKKKKIADDFKSIKIKNYLPTILNEIASDYKKQMPDFDMIRSMIFPNGCKFFYSVEDCKEDKYKNLGEKEYLRTTITSINSFSQTEKKNKKKKLPNSYNVVFSYNPQEGNNSKKSINGFSFVFYKRHNEGKVSDNKMYYFYIPYTFCILSEFPFYNSYHILCNQLYNLMKRKVEIPLEIIIYNIVNFTLSPINSDVFLNLDAFNLPHEYMDAELGEIKEDLELEIEKEEENNKDNINNNIINVNNMEENKKTSLEKVNKNNNFKKEKSENIEQSEIIKRGGNLNDISLRLLSSYSLISMSKTKPFQKIKFGHLSGYPLIQYNLVKVLLNKMSPADVITIFFYTFLEKSVIFFSKNIELLSLTINSYLNLNFPLNDEKYYFYNVSISYENYMEGNSMFIGTTFTNTIGINSKYKNNYKNNHVRLAEHLTVDLDKGIINQVEDERENDNEERDNNIFEFFKQIYKNKEMKEEEKNSILYKEVKNIFDKLSFYKELFTRKIGKDKQDEYKKVINGNYIDYDDHEKDSNNKIKKNSIKYINRDIQESFYILVNNLCIYFYQNLSLKSYDDEKKKVEIGKKESMNVIFNDENLKQNNTYIKEEKDFLAELRETMKFQSFVYGFIQSYNPIDLYKIPLTFTEEFLSMLATKSNIYNENKNNMKFLSLIDSVYKKQKKKDIYIEFNQFINEYFKKYKDMIDREIYDNYDEDKLSVIFQDDNKNTNINGFRYLCFELNNYIIFQYKYLIDNLNKKDYNSLLINNLNNINDNKIQMILLSDIENSIEKNLMEIGLLTADDICCSNIIFLFIISIKKIVMKLDYHIFLSSLFHHCKVFRKYYTMIIEIIYKLMKKSLEKKKYIEAEKYLMSYYPFINSLRLLGLVPNENLINILKKFHQVNIDELSNNNINNEDKKENDEIINNSEDIKFNNNFFYICKNFNYNKFIKEEEILKETNKLNKKDFILGNKNGKKLKPKIRFNNGEVKYEFDIYSQMRIFEILTNQYIIYISRNLDDQFLNAEIIFPICLNIMIYFRNMNIFDGKDEINAALIEMYNLFFNLYIQFKRNNKKIII